MYRTMHGIPGIYVHEQSRSKLFWGCTADTAEESVPPECHQSGNANNSDEYLK